MKLIKYKRSILILISLALIFGLGVMTSIAQEKQIRDFLKTNVMPSAAQATAETRNFKIFNHVTKSERVSIPDAEGHSVGLTVREGVQIFESGELAWSKWVIYGDMIKGAGPFDMYSTFTFQDGSIITTHYKGRVEATPVGVHTASKWTGEIIHGTGRFQGVKGTVTSSTEFFPPEKEEQMGKALSEGTLVYTLPSK